MRVRMVEAYELQLAPPGLAPRAPVRGWIDQEAVRIVREVSRAARLEHTAGQADEDAAALARALVACVLLQIVQDRPRNGPAHQAGNASTTIAMPIPPPTQSEATP